MTRQSRIAIPNVDALLDPDWARDQANRAFGVQLETARAIAQYGAQLYKRVFFTRAQSSVDDLVVAGALFHHVLSGFDGCLLCLENGAVTSAQIVARSQLEAWLYIRWALHSDRLRWARQYLVYDRRQERAWNTKLIPGEPANALHRQAWQESFGSDHEIPDDVVQRARSRISQIDAFLAKSPYAEINEWFTKARQGKRHDVEWYKAGPRAPSNLSEMAKRVNASAEYRVMYSLLSDKTHNSRSSSASRLEPEGVVVEPIRHLKDFGFAYTVATQLALLSIFLMVEQFRAGELDVLKREYLVSWKDGLKVPGIEIKTQLIRAG